MTETTSEHAATPTFNWIYDDTPPEGFPPPLTVEALRGGHKSSLV